MVEKWCLVWICISFGYIFNVSIWTFYNVFCHFFSAHFSALQFLMFLGSVFTFFFVDVTAVPSLTARISLALLLGKAGTTFFTNPLAGLLQQFLSWKRLFSCLQMSYVVGYLCYFLWACCCFPYNPSSPKARPLAFNKKENISLELVWLSITM